MVYLVYGVGFLCGKNMSDEIVSMIGEQWQINWAFFEMDKIVFVEELLFGQFNVFKYFFFFVEENWWGVVLYCSSLEKVMRI